MKEQYTKLHENIVDRGIHPDIANKIIDTLVDKFDYLDEGELISKLQDCYEGTFISEHHFLENLLDDLDLPDYVRESVDLDVLAVMMKEGVRYKDAMIAFISDPYIDRVHVLDFER